ncbi:P-loop NTPase family protein [Salinispora oceanensis]|uniref:hypothetical protein n=1 Tax=Salinispora oceanensis TaxID=1050199 RepID=UPI0003A6A2DB|nr:hypothetical protein [Salinispora oceanensis]
MTIHGDIRIRGARENNLKGVSLDLPKQKIIVFTGVSGSGKSSLAFGTIAAESQRQINETFPAFVQQFLPRYGQPDADSLQNLSAAIVVDQRRLSGNSRSTVGTATDTYTLLRLIYARLGEPSASPASAYSFNDAQGMCQQCDGLGRAAVIDVDALVDRDRLLNERCAAVPDLRGRQRKLGLLHQRRCRARFSFSHRSRTEPGRDRRYGCFMTEGTP